MRQSDILRERRRGDDGMRRRLSKTPIAGVRGFKAGRTQYAVAAAWRREVAWACGIGSQGTFILPFWYLTSNYSWACDDRGFLAEYGT